MKKGKEPFIFKWFEPILENLGFFSNTVVTGFTRVQFRSLKVQFKSWITGTQTGTSNSCDLESL